MCIKSIVQYKLYFLFGLTILVIGCTGDKPDNPSVVPTTNTGSSDPNWTIPSDEVISGGPGKDGIPSIEFPVLTDVGDVKYLQEEDLVIGFKSGHDVIAYPHAILDWHEIINDQVNKEKIAITYCPLTGTAIGWDRVIDSEETTFGVSGLLYNTNLMPYDRQTNSIWSQILNSSVNGELKTKKIKLIPLVETTWKNWKVMYPKTKVVSENTGHARPYGQYPYGSYKVNERLLFPITNSDDRIFSKERVLGVITDWGAKVYRFSSIDPEATGKIKVILDTFGPLALIIVGNKDFMVAYKMSGVNGLSDINALQNELPLILIDNLGNKYDAFGVIQEGQSVGQRLDAVESYIGFFFSFGTFYPEPEIFEP
jgi:hypothetical protein